MQSVRLKDLYKDVFSNERQARLGISNSNKCIVVCSKVETVVHQLFTCSNAKRMWKIWMDLFDAVVIEPYELLNCGSDTLSEIVNAVISNN